MHLVDIVLYSSLHSRSMQNNPVRSSMKETATVILYKLQFLKSLFHLMKVMQLRFEKLYIHCDHQITMVWTFFWKYSNLFIHIWEKCIIICTMLIHNIHCGQCKIMSSFNSQVSISIMYNSGCYVNKTNITTPF